MRNVSKILGPAYFTVTGFDVLYSLDIMRRHLSVADSARAVGMLQSGLTKRQEALQLHVSQSMICWA